MTNKNDAAWEKLFSDHNILDGIDKTGQFEISSDQINKYRESRLMTKFDHKVNLPALFKKNNLSILPISRGKYTIGSFDTYKSIKYDRKMRTEVAKFPDHLKSLDHTNLYSESAALNCAFVCNILSDIANEPLMPTISGKMSTGRFNFKIKCLGNEKLLNVDRSQCEIDGGYEGDNTLLLFEAKKQKVSDFLIRQLYYPYRLWSGKIKKDVVPIFVTHSNDQYSFFIYAFEDKENYNSLKLIEQRNYLISSKEITLSDIQRILISCKPIAESLDIPFPQANDFSKVIDLLSLLYDAEDFTLDNEFITSNFDFDARQTNYYSAAGKYLGFITSDKDGKQKLTALGKKVMELPHYEKNIEIVKQILKHDVFSKVLEKYFDTSTAPTIDQIVKIMKSSKISNVNSDNTYQRRASTVLKWVEWIIDLNKD